MILLSEVFLEKREGYLKRLLMTGFLLLRVRDECKMKMAAYQTLCDSSVVFAIKKQVEAEQGMAEMESTIKELERKKRILQNKVIMQFFLRCLTHSALENRFREQIRHHQEEFYRNCSHQ